VRVHLAGVSKHYGAQTILEEVTVSFSTGGRVGVVGPNGVGKSTLLRLAAGLEEPDDGSVSRTPAQLTVGYLSQEPERRPGESILEALGRQTGVSDAEAQLQAAAAELARNAEVGDRYAGALERFLALGGGDFEARARATCAELGLSVALARLRSSRAVRRRARR
jgi:ATPase subunit of ABC transporter with duplicated ATPase domains